MVAAHHQPLEGGLVARLEPERVAKRAYRLVVAAQRHEHVGLAYAHESGRGGEPHGRAHGLEHLLLAPGDLEPGAKAAAAARRPVYAHAIGQAGALLAASRGVRALAHIPVVDSAGAAALARSGVRVISTLASLGSRPGGAEVRQSFRRLREAGVPIVLGTDAGVLPHGGNAQELVALTEAGLSPTEAIRGATIDAAALLGAGDLGEIRVGAAADILVADILVVEGDPLRNVRTLERPVMVFQAGRRS